MGRMYFYNIKKEQNVTVFKVDFMMCFWMSITWIEPEGLFCKLLTLASVHVSFSCHLVVNMSHCSQSRSIHKYCF